MEEISMFTPLLRLPSSFLCAPSPLSFSLPEAATPCEKIHFPLLCAASVRVRGQSFLFAFCVISGILFGKCAQFEELLLDEGGEGKYNEQEATEYVFPELQLATRTWDSGFIFGAESNSGTAAALQCILRRAAKRLIS